MTGSEGAKQLTYGGVLRRVGPVLFPGEWIETLTEQETWLLERGGYFEDKKRSSPHLHLRDDNGWSPRTEAYYKAVDRYEFMRWQWAKVDDWLEEHEIAVEHRKHFDFVDLAQFEAVFDSAFPQLPATSAQAEPGRTTDRGGRPRKWDWDGAHREIIRIANEPDGLPPIQAEVVKKVAEWFLDNYDQEPAESKIKEKVRAVYAVVFKSPKPTAK